MKSWLMKRRKKKALKKLSTEMDRLRNLASGENNMETLCGLSFAMQIALTQYKIIISQPVNPKKFSAGGIVGRPTN